jgi:ABC-type sugar transport system permease subunit
MPWYSPCTVLWSMPFAVLLNQYTNIRGFAETILVLLRIIHDSFKSVLILKHLDVT